MKKPKRIRKNKRQFNNRIDADLLDRANEKRFKDNLQWSELLEKLLKEYMDEI